MGDPYLVSFGSSEHGQTPVYKAIPASLYWVV